MLFKSFRSCLFEHCPVLEKMMQEPPNKEFLQQVLDRMGIKDSSFKALYELTNGIHNDGQFPTSAYDFCDFGVIPTIEYIVDLYSDKTMVEKWSKTRVPVITSFGGDFLLLETGAKNAGKLYLYCPTFGYVDFLPTYYDSIDSMLRTIISCFELGAYKYDSNEMFLETDTALKFEICRKYNPESEYWKA